MSIRKDYKSTIKYFQKTKEVLDKLHLKAKEQFGFQRFNVSGFMQWALENEKLTNEYLEKNSRGEI